MSVTVHQGLPRPEVCSEQTLDALIASKQRRRFMVSSRVAGRRVEQPVIAFSTSEAARFAFDVLGLSCASVRPLP